MRELLKQIAELRNGQIKGIIDARLAEFAAFQNKGAMEWFSELCFCILTANSKARTGIAIQQELGADGFCSCSEQELRECIRRNRHRFHNNKARYLVHARRHGDVKKLVRAVVKESGELEAREWLAENIMGLGYKEASHFMRNVGYTDLAILDRHILSILAEHGISRPKNLTKSDYLRIENELRRFGKRLGMGLAELDLYLWYMRTGSVLK